MNREGIIAGREGTSVADHTSFDVVGFPITMYKQDPEQTPIAEWHELGGARSTNVWYLWERHGWWDNANKEAHFNVPILSEPFKNEHQALAAFEKRVKDLEKEGWRHKFTTTFDPGTNRFVPQRVP